MSSPLHLRSIEDGGKQRDGDVTVEQTVAVLRIEGSLGERLLQLIEQAIAVKSRLGIRPSQKLVQYRIRDDRFFPS